MKVVTELVVEIHQIPIKINKHLTKGNQVKKLIVSNFLETSVEEKQDFIVNFPYCFFLPMRTHKNYQIIFPPS